MKVERPTLQFYEAQVKSLVNEALSGRADIAKEQLVQLVRSAYYRGDTAAIAAACKERADAEHEQVSSDTHMG